MRCVLWDAVVPWWMETSPRHHARLRCGRHAHEPGGDRLRAPRRQRGDPGRERDAPLGGGGSRAPARDDPQGDPGGAGAHALRRADHRRGLPADPHARGHRGPALPARWRSRVRARRLDASRTLIPALASSRAAGRGERPSVGQRLGDALCDRIREILQVALAAHALGLVVRVAAAVGQDSSGRSSSLGWGRAPSSSTPSGSPASRWTSRCATARASSALLARFPDEIEHVWTAHRHRRGRHRSDGRRALRRVRHADTSRAMDAGRHAGRVGQRDGRRARGPAGHAERVHAADRDARERDGRRGCGPTWGSSSTATTSRCVRARGREIERVLGEIDGAADVVTEQLTGSPSCGSRSVATRDARSSRRSGPSRWARCATASGASPMAAVRLEEVRRPEGRAAARCGVSGPGGDRDPAAPARITIEEPPRRSSGLGQRRIIVQANVRGRDVGSFVAEARSAIHDRVPLAAVGDHVVRGSARTSSARSGRLMIGVRSPSCSSCATSTEATPRSRRGRAKRRRSPALAP